MSISNLEQILSSLKLSQYTLYSDTTKQNILMKFRGLDDVIATDFIKISLLCPISKRRIEVPVRYKIIQANLELF